MSIIPPIKIRPEGRLFITIFVVIAIILFNLAQFLGWIGVILVGWCIYFFRDPDRVTPKEPNLIISPADGVIQMIEDAVPPSELAMGDSPRTRVSVFMNVFNVHVNRIPVDGTITRLAYRPGKFVNASFDKASVDNERQSVRMETENGQEIAFVQIAGLIARRILCSLENDQKVRAGERFGMIRFGSRVDVFVPEGVTPMVYKGQTAIAGETVLADLSSNGLASDGEVP